MNGNECVVCKKYYYKIKEHYNFTGIYRSSAHQSCSLLLKEMNLYRISFYNLQKYDSHLFIKEFAGEESEIDAISLTEEKYISFTKEIK